VALAWRSGSLALWSDAAHMVTDVGALALAVVAERVAARPPDERFTYGYRRVAVLGALANGALLIAMVVLIVREAIGRLLVPVPVTPVPVVVAGAVGLAVNLAAAWVLERAGAHSLNVRGARLHLLADALGSLAALGSGLALWLTGAVWIDAWAALLVAATIAWSAKPLLSETTRVLLQQVPRGCDRAEIAAAIAQDPAVVAVGDVHVWALDEGQVVATALCFGAPELPLSGSSAASDRLRARLAPLGVGHASFEWRAVASAVSPAAGPRSQRGVPSPAGARRGRAPCATLPVSARRPAVRLKAPRP